MLLTVSGKPNDFAVTGDFSLMRSFMTFKISTWAEFEQQRKSRELKNKIIEAVGIIIKDLEKR